MAINLHLRNLSRLASNLDIRRFFIGLDIPEGGVQIVGGQDGDAFVAFSKEADLLKALNLDGRILLGQPIRLFLAKRSDMERVIQKRSDELSAAKRLRAGPADDRSRSRSRSDSPDEPPPWLKSRGRISDSDRPFDRYSPDEKRRRMNEDPISQNDRVETILRGQYDIDDRDELSSHDDRENRRSYERDERSRSPETGSSHSRRASERSYDNDSDSDRRTVSDNDSVGEPSEYVEPGYIVIGNLPLTVTARDLRECFDRYEIADGGITMKSDDKDPNVLLAYVKFVSLKDAVKVDCTCEGLMLHGRPIEIKMITSSAYESADQPSPIEQTTSFGQQKEQYSQPAQYTQWPGAAYPQMYPGYPPASPPPPGPHGYYQGIPRPPFYPPRGPPVGMCPYPAHPYSGMPGPNPYAAPMGQGTWRPPYHPPYPTSVAGTSHATGQPENQKQKDRERRTANISVLEHKKATSERKQGPAGKQEFASQQMPLTQFVGPYIQKMFYIRLSHLPAYTTACRIWELLGSSKGPTAGVVLFRRSNGKPMHATIAYPSRDERDIAKGSNPIFARTCCRSDGPAVHNFFAQELTHRDKATVSESTSLGVDRIVTYDEKIELLRALPNKTLGLSRISKLQALYLQRTDTQGIQSATLSTPSDRKVPAIKSAIVSTSRDIKVQGIQSTTVSTPKDRSHRTVHAIPRGPTEKAAVQRGPRGLKGLQNARHVLRFVKLQPETTACEVWSWFEGAKGPATGVLLVRDEEGKALFAFVIFSRDYTVYRDSIRRDRYTVIHKPLAVNELRSLKSEYKVFESSQSGKDVQLCIKTQLAAIEPEESKKAEGEKLGTEKKSMSAESVKIVEKSTVKKHTNSESVKVVAATTAKKDTGEKPKESVMLNTEKAGTISVCIHQVSERKPKKEAARDERIRLGPSTYTNAPALIYVSKLHAS